MRFVSSLAKWQGDFILWDKLGSLKLCSDTVYDKILIDL